MRFGTRLHIEFPRPSVPSHPIPWCSSLRSCSVHNPTLGSVATKGNETKCSLEELTGVQDGKQLQIPFSSSNWEADPTLHLNLGCHSWRDWPVEWSWPGGWTSEANSKVALQFPPSSLGMPGLGKPAAMQEDQRLYACHARKAILCALVSSPWWAQPSSLPSWQHPCQAVRHAREQIINPPARPTHLPAECYPVTLVDTVEIRRISQPSHAQISYPQNQEL